MQRKTNILLLKNKNTGEQSKMYYVTKNLLNSA